MLLAESMNLIATKLTGDRVSAGTLDGIVREREAKVEGKWPGLFQTQSMGAGSQRFWSRYLWRGKPVMPTRTPMHMQAVVSLIVVQYICNRWAYQTREESPRNELGSINSVNRSRSVVSPRLRIQVRIYHFLHNVGISGSGLIELAYNIYFSL